MPVLQRILAEVGIERPDGRPLYALPMSEEKHAEIGKLLCFRVASKHVIDSTAARFVLWAAEHIRARFDGGQLTWKFIFQGLGLPEDRNFAVKLVEHGLQWWGRKVRVSEAGVHLYLYTLMAEGGLPQALLVQPGLYQRVIKGLLADIEAEGTDIPGALAYRIAARRVMELPQTFQTEDIVRLLADLTLALVRLRSEAPWDIPLELMDRWLDKHRPNWVQSLPLRLSKDIADTLIRPALRAERKTLLSAGPLAWRTLRRNEATGDWRAVVRIAEHGVLATAMLPHAEGLRLRFWPTGIASETAGSIIYTAAPDDGGWTLRRIGGGGPITIPLDLDAPFALSGFADGRMVGEVDIIPAWPSPEEAPSLWRAPEASEDSGIPGELLPLSGAGKTRASHVWFLTAAGVVPAASEGLVLSKPQAAPGGVLWSVRGTGDVRLGEHRWRIATGADEDAPDARLLAHGDILPDWRLAGIGGHVFRGTPQLLGERHTGALWPLGNADIQRRSARILMGEIAEWVEKGAVLARLRYVALPELAQLVLREAGPGALELRVEGLPPGLSLKLVAGQTVARMRLADGAGQLTLSVPGAPPGLVMLSLIRPETGTALELIAPWPARNGMILSPGNLRLERDTPLSVEALRGWRAISPASSSGDIQFHLDGRLSVAVRVEGEMPLAAYIPLIRSMLAHAGPDAQIRLSLIVEGKEGHRLEIRRYHRQAVIQNGQLRLGLARDERAGKETAFSKILGRGKAILHAVDLDAPERTQCLEIDVNGAVDPRSLLPEGDALWLIQATFEGQAQRPVVWSPHPIPYSAREQRIAKYATDWTRLLKNPEDSSWERQWKLIRAVGQHGDAGVLDQVQALAKVPAAAVALLLRVSKEELTQVLALDMAAPVFWPALPVGAFRAALACEHARFIGRYIRVLDQREAENEAIMALARRISAVLTLHPEIAGHFGAALTDADFLASLMSIDECGELLGEVLVSAPDKRLAEYAQEAARRFDRLPSGVKGREPHTRPPGLIFNPYLQPVIDAPLVTAEIAAGLRPAPDTALMLALINLRLVDPPYFDSALPAALAFVRQKARS